MKKKKEVEEEEEEEEEEKEKGEEEEEEEKKKKKQNKKMAILPGIELRVSSAGGSGRHSQGDLLADIAFFVSTKFVALVRSGTCQIPFTRSILMALIAQRIAIFSST